MKKAHRYIIFVFLALFFTGCVGGPNMGPVGSPEFPSLVATASLNTDGKIHFFGQAEWLPNVRGFTSIRDYSLARGASSVTVGVLVLTDKSILFQQWNVNNEKFDIVKRLSYLEIKKISLDSLGRNRMLAVQKNDFSYDSFSFIKPKGFIADPKKTEKAFHFLKGRLAQ